MSEGRLAGRVALITGASRGIGAGVAEAMAAEGARVILLARSVSDLEKVDDKIQAAGGAATLMPFDLRETEKIAAIGPAVFDKFGRLDILVGNAAMLGALSPVAMSDPKTLQNVFKVNFFANHRLISTLDPLLRAAPAGRAMFVTSGFARVPAPFWGGYAASKAALESLVAAYAAEVAYSPLKVGIVDPGIVATDMRAEAFPGEDPSALPTPKSVAQKFVTLACDDDADIWNVENRKAG